jgi:hypothetical protein
MQRPGPDTEGDDRSMQFHRNATCAVEAPVDGLVPTRYTLVVCVVCRHERIHTARQETSCSQCGGSARRSFALFRELREER